MADHSLGILDSLRIGSVPYLNAKPLLFGIENRVILEHPSLLANDFIAGKLDVALLPVHSVIDRSDVFIANGISISSSGPVYSVFLAHREEIKDISTIHLDPASRTSTNLIQVICRQFLKMSPVFSSEAPANDAARLLIGDQAIAFRREMDEGWHLVDLGEVWTNFTKLPFVYAVWVIRNTVTDAKEIAEELRDIKKRGVASLSEIIERLPAEQRPLAESYLNGYIRYDLGNSEKQAIELFSDYLQKQSLVDGVESLKYI